MVLGLDLGADSAQTVLQSCTPGGLREQRKLTNQPAYSENVDVEVSASRRAERYLGGRCL